MEREFIRAASVAVLAILCAACATQMRAPEPGKASAMLRYMTTSAPGYTHFFHINTSSCPQTAEREMVAGTGPGPLILLDEKEKSTLNMLGSSGKSENYIRERVIPAGQLFIYELHAAQVAVQYTPGFTCTNSGSFIAEPGAQYELFYDVTFRGERCAVSLYQLVPDGQNQFNRREVSSLRVFYPPSNSASYCSRVR